MGVLKVGGKSFYWGWERERAKARRRLDKAVAESVNQGTNDHFVFSAKTV